MSENTRKNSNWCDSNKYKKNNKCSDKVDKDCCCGIKTLRKILELLQREDIIVDISTKARNYEGLIFDLTEDVVYISEVNGDGRPDHFIPLCNIIRINFTIDPGDFRDEVREEIENLIKPTSNTNPCCCTDGIADAINDIRRFRDPEDDLCFATALSPPDICVDVGEVLKANDDVVFIDRTVIDNSFILISTCQIKSISVSPELGFTKQS